jgi:hypothetical protein
MLKLIKNDDQNLNVGRKFGSLKINPDVYIRSNQYILGPNTRKLFDAERELSDWMIAPK